MPLGMENTSAQATLLDGDPAPPPINHMRQHRLKCI